MNGIWTPKSFFTYRLTLQLTFLPVLGGSIDVSPLSSLGTTDLGKYFCSAALSYLFIHLSICLFAYLSVCLFVYLSIRLFVYWSIGLFVYLSICLFVYLSICLFVYVYLSIWSDLIRFWSILSIYFNLISILFFETTHPTTHLATNLPTCLHMEQNTYCNSNDVDLLTFTVKISFCNSW